MADRGTRVRALAVAAGVAAAVVVGPAPARAIGPHEVLADPALEARARSISKDLRCLVCQNQSIDDSDAELARDLRMLVRERLTAGDSDDEVVNYLVSRYGDFVLLKPPFKPATYALWLGPLVLVIIGGLAAVGYYRRRPATPEPRPLDPEEEARLSRLLDHRRR